MSDAAKLDRHWHIMRMSSDDVPGKHLLEEAEQKDVGQGPNLSDAVALNLRLKGQNKPPAFAATLKRGYGYLIDCCGMKELAAYTRSDATKFRDYLFVNGLNGASRTMVYLGRVGRDVFIIRFAKLDQAGPLANHQSLRPTGQGKR